MKKSEAFPAKWLAAEDLKGKRVLCTIENVEMETVGDGEKPVAHFKELDKGYPLNITNANSIEMIVGTDEMDDWHGSQITLYPTKVPFGKKIVSAIRIDPPDTKKVATPKRKSPK